MTDLFEHAEKYPNGPGYARGSDTSREAAERLTARTFIHDAVIELLEGRADGLIVDEVRAVMERRLGRKFDRTTIGARFTELEKLGRIIKTDEKRQTPMGRNAAVYKLKK